MRTGRASRSLELHIVSVCLKSTAGFPRSEPVWSPPELPQTAVVLHQGVLRLGYVQNALALPLLISSRKASSALLSVCERRQQKLAGRKESRAQSLGRCFTPGAGHGSGGLVRGIRAVRNQRRSILCGEEKLISEHRSAEGRVVSSTADGSQLGLALAFSRESRALPLQLAWEERRRWHGVRRFGEPRSFINPFRDRIHVCTQDVVLLFRRWRTVAAGEQQRQRLKALVCNKLGPGVCHLSGILKPHPWDLSHRLPYA